MTIPIDTKKPTDIPMPVASVGAVSSATNADIPEIDPQPSSMPIDNLKNESNKDHIHNDDSGLIPNETTTTETDQIDAGGFPQVTPPALPPPSVPFSEGDPMGSVGHTDQKTKLIPPFVGESPKNTLALSDMDLDKQISDKKTAGWLRAQGGEYRVHGIYRPDAASIQGAANKNKVSTEILVAVQTPEYAEVIVRTHYDGQYVDTVVHHDFENSRNMLLLEMATKHPDTVSGLSSTGLPMFKQDAVFEDKAGKEKNLMLTVMHTLLADIQFSIRDATTKAAASGQAKILNQDWRDELEIESEFKERELVESLKGS